MPTEPVARVQRLNQPTSSLRQRQQVGQYMQAAQQLILKAHAQQDRQALQQAMERIAAARNIDPRAPEPLMGLAYLLYLADQPQAALQTLEQIPDAGPHFLAVADLKRMLSERSGHQGKTQIVQSFAQQVLATEPTSPAPAEILTEALSPLSVLGGTGGLDFSALAQARKKP